jgi:hypothetical protein
MKASRLALAIGLPALALTAGAVLLPSLDAPAADHLDPPGRADPLVDPRPDAPADLADVYAFFDADNVVFAVTFGGPAATNLPAAYDRDVLYTLHLSNDGDPGHHRISGSHPLRVRRHPPRRAGDRLPGNRSVQGPVETDLQQNGIIVRAGLFDDPFFFDSQGLRESRQTGTIRFNNKRSFFDGKNITAVVIQMPRSLIQNGNNRVHVWSQTGRIGGQL